MVNERDEKYEGEYQFSDEDVNYDVENESAGTTEQHAVPVKQNALAKLGPYRRMIIGLLVYYTNILFQ